MPGNMFTRTFLAPTKHHPHLNFGYLDHVSPSQTWHSQECENEGVLGHTERHPSQLVFSETMTRRCTNNGFTVMEVIAKESSK